MSAVQIGVIVAAAAVAAWPQIASVVKSLALGGIRLPSRAPAASSVSYEKAIRDIAEVRFRLVDTDLLTDEAKKAIDSLTLALVAGSDK